MLSLFAPILTQIVTVSAADRTEARLVVADTKHYEAATYPAIGLGFSERRFHLIASYSPAITVIPLESTPRQVLVLHSIGLGAGYSWRRTAVNFGQTLSFGEQNFAVLATSGAVAPSVPTMPGGTPTPGTPTPGTPTPGTPNGQASPSRSLGTTIPFFSYSAALSAAHSLSASTNLTSSIGYSVAGGADTESRALLPKVQGVTASGGANQQFDSANLGSLGLSLQYSESSNARLATSNQSIGTQTWFTSANAGWSHRFNVMTSTRLETGLTGARNSRDDGYVAYSVYPTFGASMTHSRRLKPGSVTLGLSVSSAPALDFETLIVDPRIGLGGFAGYQRDRFSATFNLASSFSESRERGGNFSGLTGALGAGYAVGAAVSLVAGVRVAWQSYQGQTTLPFTYTGFVGVSIALSDQL